MRQELAELANCLADGGQNGKTIDLPEMGHGPADRHEALAVQDRTQPTPICQGQKLTVKFGDLDAISLEIV
jgi:hypothetical protein